MKLHTVVVVICPDRQELPLPPSRAHKRAHTKTQ